MSKAMLALVLLASVVLYDPQRVLAFLGPQAQAFGLSLKSALDITRILPQWQWSQIDRR